MQYFFRAYVKLKIPEFSSEQQKHDGWTGPLLTERLWWISYVYQISNPKSSGKND